MVILIYFLISLVGGIIPAFIAKQLKKNFILWWIYGAIFLPIALLHVILLILKVEKGILAVRILLILYGIVTFYFVTWAVSTQPEAVKWLKFGQNKYALGKTLYEQADEITHLIMDVTDYLASKTTYDRGILKRLFSGIDMEKVSDIAYLEDYGRIKIKEIDEGVENKILTPEEGRIAKDVVNVYNKMTGEIASFQFTSVMDFLDEKTDVERAIIDDEMIYFENEKHIDKEYVQKFGIEFLQAIENYYKATINKGAYEEWSVPMGEAKNVFNLYLLSLKDLNIYLKDVPSVLENNYMAYLKTESLYFHTTTIVKEYMDHLDLEAAKNLEDERVLELIEHYIFIGDSFVATRQKDASNQPYDKAIALYRNLIAREGKKPKEKAEYFFYIGELYGKRNQIDSVLSVFNEFLAQYFGGGLFMNDDAIYDLEGYMKLEIIMDNMAYLKQAIKEFVDYVDQFSSTEKEQVCRVENRILHIFFPKIPKAERNNYVRIIKDNFDYLISPKNLEVFPIIREAFDFFDQFKFDEIAQSYIELLDDVEPIVFAAVDDINNSISIGLFAELKKAKEYVDGVFIKGSILDQSTMDEISELQDGIKLNSKDAIDMIIKIRDIMADMDELIKHMDKNQELKDKLARNLESKKLEINSVQSSISKTTKDFNDVVKNIVQENSILTEEYDAMLSMINEAKELGDSLGLVPPGQRKSKKADMIKLRAEIKNEVTSLATIIDNIVAAKKEVAKQYEETPATEQLLEIKDKLIILKDEIDKLVEKYFPGELAKIDAES